MEELGRQLREAGLNEAALAELFGDAWSGEDVPLVLDRYRGGDPRVPLVRLFVLAETVEAGSLPVPVAALVDAGLVEVEDGRAAPAWR